MSYPSPKLSFARRNPKTPVQLTAITVWHISYCFFFFHTVSRQCCPKLCLGWLVWVKTVPENVLTIEQSGWSGTNAQTHTLGLNSLPVWTLPASPLLWSRGSFSRFLYHDLPLSLGPTLPCTQHTDPWNMTKCTALTEASASCCLLPTPPESSVEMLTVWRKGGLPALRASITAICSIREESWQESLCWACSTGEGQEALVRTGRGTGPAYHNIPCRHSHCVQVSTLKNKISVLGPTCMSCRLHMAETPSWRMSAIAVKGMPEAVQTDTK